MKKSRHKTCRSSNGPANPNRERKNKFKKLKAVAQICFSVVIATLVGGTLTSTLCSAEPKAEAQPPKTDATITITNATPAKTNSAELNTKSAENKKVSVKGKLTGAELYSMHCNRCHPERYPTERTSAQWNTILLHMQIRANLPGSQARMILKYLQENSGR